MKDKKDVASARRSRREAHAPLADELIADEAPRVHPKRQEKRRGRATDESLEEQGAVVDDRLSRRILQQAHEQQMEEEDEAEVQRSRLDKHKRKVSSALMSKGKGSAMRTGASASASSAATADSSDDEDEDDAATSAAATDMARLKGEELLEAYGLNERDEEAVNRFMSTDAPQRRTLGDFIRDRITERMTEVASQAAPESTALPPLMQPKIEAVYRSVGALLAKYRSGKLPKALKLVPVLSNWEDIVYLMEPDQWTAAAMFAVTRVFSSNLNAKMAQRFMNLVLLPRVRDDIAEYKQLNYHLYQALAKALFKPAAFFKGILIPLCESGTCTLREAVIVGSVLAKVSAPVLHAAAAMLKIAEMDYTGANSIFLRILLNKKYALPFRVIDALVYHFLRFENDSREMPVLWHQCLLVFVQRYKSDIAVEQKEALLGLLRRKSHPGVTPAIRFEIVHSESRGGQQPMEMEE